MTVFALYHIMYSMLPGSSLEAACSSSLSKTSKVEQGASRGLSNSAGCFLASSMLGNQIWLFGVTASL